METYLLVSLILVMVLFLFLEGFLSGSEIAMVAADRKKLSSLARSSSRMDRLTLRVLKDPSWFLSTTLVGSNLAEVTNVALVTSILVSEISKMDQYEVYSQENEPCSLLPIAEKVKNDTLDQ